GCRAAGPPGQERQDVRGALQLGPRGERYGGAPARDRWTCRMTVRTGSTRQRPRKPGGRMFINVSARRCRVADSVRRRAEDRLRRMIRFEPRIDSADVIFEHDHGLYAVEVRAFVTGR